MGVNPTIFKASFICPNIDPIGDRNCNNLIFTTPDKFIPRTLEVFLQGNKLTKDLDYTVNATDDGFTLILNPANRYRLDLAPSPNDDFTVNYVKKCN